MTTLPEGTSSGGDKVVQIGSDLDGTVDRFSDVGLVVELSPGYADGSEFRHRSAERIDAVAGRRGVDRGVSKGCCPRGLTLVRTSLMVLFGPGPEGTMAVDEACSSPAAHVVGGDPGCRTGDDADEHRDAGVRGASPDADRRSRALDAAEPLAPVVGGYVRLGPELNVPPLANFYAVREPSPTRRQGFGDAFEARGDFERVLRYAGDWVCGISPLPGDGTADDLLRAGFVFAEGSDTLVAPGGDAAARRERIDALRDRVEHAPARLDRSPGDFTFVHLRPDGSATGARSVGGLAPLFYAQLGDGRGALGTRIRYFARYANLTTLDWCVLSIWTTTGHVPRRPHVPRGVPRPGCRQGGDRAPGRTGQRTDVLGPLGWCTARRTGRVRPDAARPTAQIGPHPGARRQPPGPSTRVAGPERRRGLVGSRSPLRADPGPAGLDGDGVARPGRCPRRQPPLPREPLAARAVPVDGRDPDPPGEPQPPAPVRPPHHHAGPQRDHVRAAGAPGRDGRTVFFGGQFADDVVGGQVSYPDWAAATPLWKLLRFSDNPDGLRDLARWALWRLRLRRGLAPRPSSLPAIYSADVRSEWDQWRRDAAERGSPAPTGRAALRRAFAYHGWVVMTWEIATEHGVRPFLPFSTRADIEWSVHAHPRELLGPGLKKPLRRALEGDVPPMNLHRPKGGPEWDSQRWQRPVPLARGLDDRLAPVLAADALHAERLSGADASRIEYLEKAIEGVEIARHGAWSSPTALSSPSSNRHRQGVRR